MPYFKDKNQKVHYLESEEFVDLLPGGCVSITDEEAATLVAPTPSDLWKAHQARAQVELDFSDKVCTRCMKAGQPYPAEWDARDKVLRDIIRASSGDPTQPLPTRPAYPANT